MVKGNTKQNKTSGKGRGKGKKKAATPSPRPSPSASVAVSSDDDWPNRPQVVKPVPDPEQADHEPASLEDAQDEGEATGLVKVKVRTKKSCRLRDEKQEGEVLEWVEENELLWNSKHKEFQTEAQEGQAVGRKG